jgi:hypothetical protein
MSCACGEQGKLRNNREPRFRETRDIRAWHVRDLPTVLGYNAFKFWAAMARTPNAMSLIELELSQYSAVRKSALSHRSKFQPSIPLLA